MRARKLVLVCWSSSIGSKHARSNLHTYTHTHTHVRLSLVRSVIILPVSFDSISTHTLILQFSHASTGIVIYAAAEYKIQRAGSNQSAHLSLSVACFRASINRNHNGHRSAGIINFQLYIPIPMNIAETKNRFIGIV